MCSKSPINKTPFSVSTVSRLTDYTDSVPGCKPVHRLRAADKAVCASVSHRAECNNINISLSLLHGLGQVG